MKKELTFTFTVDETNYILAGLQELPGKICNPMIKKIQDQATAQMHPVPVPVSEAAK